MKFFENGSSWLKGNFHMHTTESDGRLTPSEAVRLYKEAGYDFVALTDHRKVNAQKEEDGFLVLSGAEWDTGNVTRLPIYHILGIGMERPMRPIYRQTAERFHRDPFPQEIIYAVREAGGIAILAHPAWSVMTPEELLDLRGLSGAEIYNTVSGLPWNPDRADASLYFDIWAKNGRLVPCFAGDDTHHYDGDGPKCCTRVGARKLGRKEILEAVMAGRVYASQGPAFDYISLDGDTVGVGFSGDVETVVFLTNTPWGNRNIQSVKGIGETVFHLNPTDVFFRIELIGGDGKKAWSSPYPVLKGGTRQDRPAG